MSLNLKKLEINKIKKILENAKKKDIRANLQKIDFSHMNLNGLDFSYADLTWSHWFKASICACKFNNAILQYAHLDTINACSADFTNADLTSAYLFGAKLGYSNLTNTKMRGCSLTQALTGGVVGKTIITVTQVGKFNSISYIPEDDWIDHSNGEFNSFKEFKDWASDLDLKYYNEYQALIEYFIKQAQNKGFTNGLY